MLNPIKTFEPNTKGRDFAIGDLHGALSAFLNLLENLKFDPAVDRMFSVGDLVDRGPESRQCLELMREPWFYNVLANHEQMLYEAFFGGYMGQFFWRNGGSWARSYHQEFQAALQDKHLDVGARHMSEDTLKFMELVEMIEELPFIMTIGLTNGQKVHIIHAEIPPGFVVTDAMLSSPKKVIELATQQSSDGDYFVWGRHKYMNFYRHDLSNHAKNIRVVAYANRGAVVNDKLSHIISGHTIVQRPMTILGQTNIDTGAWDSYPNIYGSKAGWPSLTCLELNTWKFYQATETEFREVEPEVVNRDDIATIKD